MSILTDNSSEPAWTALQLQSTYIPVQGRKKRYTNELSSTGIPNYGMSPWGMVTGVLNSLGITGTPTATIWNKVLIVAENGNDSTGVRNDLTKPFRTIGAAMAQAVDRDIVLVQPGNYAEVGTTVVIKPNVSIYCQAGVQVTITDFAPTTFTIGGRHGIFGHGSWTFLNTLVAEVTPTATAAEFVFEAELILYSNVSIIWGGCTKFRLQTKYLSKANATAISVNRNSIVGHYDFVIGFVDDAGNASKYIECQSMFAGTSVDIKIGKATANRMNKETGFMYSAANANTCTIKLQVDKFKYSGGTTVDESKAPLVCDATCNAQKDITFSSFETTGQLYTWAISELSGTSALSTMNFQGIVKGITTGAGAVLDTFIDFGRQNQQVIFNLNVIDETSNTLSGNQALLNVASYDGKQKVRGYLYTERVVANCPGIIVYGKSILNVAATAHATLDNLTIVSPVGAASIRFLGGTPGIPCKNVYATAPTSADNGGVTFLIDSGITVDTNVK